MTQFDESKIRRDGDGKFASKGPSAEAEGVDLAGQEYSAAEAHAASRDAYGVHIQSLMRQVREAQAERSRHELAQQVLENSDPSVRFYEMEFGVSDHGDHEVYVSGPGRRADGGVDRASSIVVGADYAAAKEDHPWKEFAADGRSDTLDTAKVRAWAEQHSEPVNTTELAWKESSNLSKIAEHQQVKEIASDVKAKFPTATSVEMYGSEYGGMEYNRITDAEGKVLHSASQDDAFAEELNQKCFSLYSTDRHWPDGTSEIDSDEYGNVNSATIDIETASKL